MGLRRGFKTEAEWYAADVRKELSLRAWDPICPRRMADLLNHKVVDLSAFQATHPTDVGILRQCTGPKGFSAVTLYKGALRLIVLNDGHSAARQAADIAHELAHALLHHKPLPFNADAGVRAFNADDEEEAKWLGPTLLVPRPAAVGIARRGEPESDAADRYGVSVELMRLRLYATGARQHGKYSAPPERSRGFGS